jgi:hypothetical protein
MTVLPTILNRHIRPNRSNGIAMDQFCYLDRRGGIGMGGGFQTATGISLPEAERSIASSSDARGACDREVLAAKHNQALRMKARLLSFGFSLLLQPQNMCA